MYGKDKIMEKYEDELDSMEKVIMELNIIS